MVPDNTSEDRRAEYINNLVTRINNQQEELKAMLERVNTLQRSVDFNKLRLGEARLIKDIRDGRLVVFHTDTNMPAKISFFEEA